MTDKNRMYKQQVLSVIIIFTSETFKCHMEIIHVNCDDNDFAINKWIK